MTCTTKEQALRLLKKSSLLVESADLYWVFGPGVCGEVLRLKFGAVMITEHPCDDVCPAWSLGRLWDLVRTELDMKETYVFDTNRTSEELLEHLVKILTGEV